MFDKLSDSYAKHYSLTEHLAFDEIIVLFKATVIVKSIYQRNTSGSGISSTSCVILRDTLKV